MTDVKNEKRSSMNRKTNQLMNEQLQKLLNFDHIRQHLIKVGLITKYGEVISKEEHKRRSRRRRTSHKNMENGEKHRPMTAISTRHSIENTKNSKHSRRSKSPDYHQSNDRRYKTISMSPSRYKNKSQSPKRLSSPNQSTRTNNISIRRTVSPKTNDRCFVTMIYYGPQTIIDYERNWFESEGDEIIVMQQHCGGENLIVYKGALKPNETFQFESRRHSTYPFALAFYVNGLIDNRLSICCEARYKHNVRIGGKRGLFGITNVQNSKACRRCRFEQRMKRLAELKAQSTAITYEISTPEPNITRSTTPDSKQQQESSSLNQELETANLPNFETLEEKIPTPHKKEQLHRLPSISTDDGTIANQTNTYLDKLLPKINRKTNTDE